MSNLREEAIYMLLWICKGFAVQDKDSEKVVLDATLKALRVLGVTTDELVKATLSMAMGDSPIDRTFEGKPLRPTPPMEEMFKELLNLAVFSKNNSNTK